MLLRRFTKLVFPVLTLSLAACGAVLQGEREPQRLVALDGASNFRDLGGYETEDGRSVKWGLIYRSDKLVNFTDTDVETLKNRNIKTVIDFRSEQERSKDPDRLPANVEIVRNLRLKQGVENADALVKRLMAGDIDAAESRKILLDGYSKNVIQGGAALGEMFTMLADDQAPLLFHCSAGKDRTGVAAAVLLSLLGVPRDVIVEDYVATEKYREEAISKMFDQVRQYSEHPNAIAALKARLARPEYILHPLELIDRQYGGVENYARNEMGLSDETIAKLKTMYLE